MVIQISKDIYKLLFNINKSAKKYFKHYNITRNYITQNSDSDKSAVFYTKIYGDFSSLFSLLCLSDNEYICISTDHLTEIMKTNKVTKFTNISVDSKGHIGLQTSTGEILLYGKVFSKKYKPLYWHISYDVIDKVIENDKFIQLNENQVQVLLDNLRLRMVLFDSYDFYLVKNFFPLLGRKLKDDQSISISLLDTGGQHTFYSMTRFINDNLKIYNCFLCMKVRHN